MLSQHQVQFFRGHGYLILEERVLDQALLETLRERLDRVVAGTSEGSAESVRNLTGGDLASDRVVVQIVNIWQADPVFRDLIYAPDITGMSAQLVGDDTLRLWHDQIQHKPPVVGAPTEWHQDHPYWPIIEPPDLVSCWIALDDATMENGCMRVVPGSHKWGAVPGGLRSDVHFNPAYDDGSFIPPGADLTPVPCEVKAGSCMFHHCLTWHGSYFNRSPRHRRAIALHYMPGYTRYEPKGGHLVEHNVTVKPGEVLHGPTFPTVREKGQPMMPVAA